MALRVKGRIREQSEPGNSCRFRECGQDSSWSRAASSWRWAVLRAGSRLVDKLIRLGIQLWSGGDGATGRRGRSRALGFARFLSQSLPGKSSIEKVFRARGLRRRQLAERSWREKNRLVC